ncbi:MAG: hypothetical protein AAGA68_17685 [Pseudomonadota bacterium]
MMELIRYGWAQDPPTYRQAVCSMYLPDGSGEQLHWFAELQRRSATPEMAIAVMEMTGKIDVAHRLGVLDVPTLVDRFVASVTRASYRRRVGYHVCPRIGFVGGAC